MHKSDLCNSTDVEQEARDAYQMEAFDYKFLAESIRRSFGAHNGRNLSLLYHNPQWHDYTGLTRDETSEGGWHQIVHSEDLPKCLEHWTHSLRTGDPMEMELRFKRADGEHWPVSSKECKFVTGCRGRA